MKVPKPAAFCLGLFLWAYFSSVSTLWANGFIGEFAPNSGQWQTNVQDGSVLFQGVGALVIQGPSGGESERFSDDSITFSGENGVGLAHAYSLRFHWVFDAGNSLAAEAGFSLNGFVTSLASGSLGMTASGDFAVLAEQGDRFSFGLFSDYYKGTSPELRITAFEVPDEASPIALLGSMLLFLGAGYAWTQFRSGSTLIPSRVGGGSASFGVSSNLTNRR